MTETFTQDDLNSVIEEFQDRSAELLKTKGEEYSKQGDRLRNFRQISDLANLRMEQACCVLLLKHVQSLAQAVDENDREWAWETSKGSEGLKQRVADAINYLFLLAAILEHEHGNGG